MKKLLLSTTSLLLLAGSAIAADLPSHKAAPVYAAPAAPWTGFYAGLNAGYNFGTNGAEWGALIPPGSDPGDVLPPSAAPHVMSIYGNNGGSPQSGFIGGGQIGYSYQYGSTLLLGIEADIQGAGIRGSSYATGDAQSGYGGNYGGSPDNYINEAIGSTAIQGGIDWLGTVRGRAGYLWTPTLLFYGTGGFAYAGAYANVVQSAIDQRGSDAYEIYQSAWFSGGRNSQIQTGWTAGGGVEWMFMPNWSLKAEALYWYLGRMNVDLTAIGVSPEPAEISNKIALGRTTVSYQGVTARAGINYHFNWGTAPVIASY
jgi:outer membrane immunogenic protein